MIKSYFSHTLKQSSKSTFITFSLTLILVTFFLTNTIYVFEYSYGNGDGIWLDKDIIHTTYKLLLVEMLLIVLIFGTFFSNKIISYFLFLIISTSVLIYGLEIVSTLIVNIQNKPKNELNIISMVRDNHELSVEPDNILGVKARRNAHISWLPKNRDNNFDLVQINIDSLSRRITPQSSCSVPEKYSMFMGCSYTFGDGVSDDKTMPYYFQKNSPKYKAYNLGYLAYSPLHALAQLQQTSVEHHIPEKNGFAVFTYINDHIDRVIPATRWIELTKGKFPYLNEGNMETDGLYRDRRRVYTNMVLNAQTSGIKQLFKLGYPKYHTKKHYMLVIDIFQKINNEYNKHFKNNNFYVVIFPGNPMPPEMKIMLKNSKIKYFDYSELISTTGKMLSFDNAHPAPILYEIVARRLSQDIAKIELGN